MRLPDSFACIKRVVAGMALLLCPGAAGAQDRLPQVADSLRRALGIPELGFAVVKTDTIARMGLFGYHRADRQDAADTARPSDRFHLGSNTKAITAFIAGWLADSGRISWTTPFFSLFPEWKASSNAAYGDITLADLLSHRARIQPYMSGADFRKLPAFKGSPSEQRAQFAAYLLKQEPVAADTLPYHYSNAGYSIAALMLEKASGRIWERLVEEVLSEKLGLRYGLGWPNKTDESQPSGHWMMGGKLRPVPASIDYNLHLAEPAGDIAMPLADYARFIQLNLQGLQGRDNLLKAATYEFLHFGRPAYAMGWANVNNADRQLSEHAGSAGTFYCYTVINRKAGIAYIVMANAGAAVSQAGASFLAKAMAAAYRL